MQWSNMIVIPVVMVGCFMGGYFCRYMGEQRSGGVTEREMVTNNSRRINASSQKQSSVKPRHGYGGRSPTAAAQNNKPGQVCPVEVRQLASAFNNGLGIETTGNSLVVRSGYEAGKAGSNSDCLEPSPNCREPGGESGLCQALNLLWKAESGYGENMSGDGGYAKGHFQQHRSHWVEGCRMLGVSWVYPEDTSNLARAAAITAANWAKYVPQALKDGDLELLIRSHRLPSAPYRADNQEYVDRVLKGE